DLEGEAGSGDHCLEDGGGAGHVRLHRLHGLGRLEGEAARIEGDPLPTRARVFWAPRALYSIRTRRGGFSEPRPTPRMPPKPSFSSSFSSHTRTASFSDLPYAVARSAKFAGVRSAAGMLTSVRVSHTAPATI